MKFGQYEISNSLIGIILVTSFVGIGIATGTTSDVANAAAGVLGQSENDNQFSQNQSPNSETEVEQNNQGEDSSDSDTSVTSGSNSDTDQESDGDNQQQNNDASETSNQETTQDETTENTSNQETTQDETTENTTQQVTEDSTNTSTDTSTDTTSSVSITSPNNGEILNSNTVSISGTLKGSDASYEIKLDGSVQESGQVNGEKDLSTTINVNSDGFHEIKIDVKKSGQVVSSDSIQFSLSTSTTSGSTSQAIEIFDPDTSKTYETTTVPILTTLQADDASYWIIVNDQTRLSGSINDSKTVDQSIELVNGSNTVEIKINETSGDPASKTLNVDVDTGPTTVDKDGIYLQDNVTAGEITTVRFFEEGQALSGESVYLDGVLQGQTDSNGVYDFSIPNKQQVNISAASYSNVYDVQGYEEPLDMGFSFDGEIYLSRDSTVTVTYAENSTAIPDVEIFADGISKGITDSNGQLTMSIDWQAGDNVVIMGKKTTEPKKGHRDNETFQTTVPPMYFSWVNISDGGTFDSSPKLINPGVQSEEDAQVSVEMDGSTLKEFSVPYSQDYVYDNVTMRCLDSGEQTVLVEATGNRSGKTFSDQISFNVNQPHEIAEIEIPQPETDDPAEADINAEVDVWACNDVQYSAKVTQSGSQITEVYSGSLQRDEVFKSGVTEVDLSPGDYNFTVTTTSTDDTHTIRKPFSVIPSQD